MKLAAYRCDLKFHQGKMEVVDAFSRLALVTTPKNEELERPAVLDAMPLRALQVARKQIVIHF